MCWRGNQHPPSVQGGPADHCISLLGPHPSHHPSQCINSSHRTMPLTQGWPRWRCHPLSPGCCQLDFIQHFPELGIIDVPNGQVELWLETPGAHSGKTQGPPPYLGSAPEQQRDACPLKATYSLTCVPVGRKTWILMGSSCQAVATVKRCTHSWHLWARLECKDNHFSIWKL